MSYMKELVVARYEADEREEFKQWREKWFKSFETPFDKMGFYAKK